MEEMMFASKKSQDGFTLIELLVAVVILAIGLLGLVQLQVTAIKTNAQSTSATAAAAIAQKIVEEIAALPSSHTMFDAPSSGNTWVGSPFTVEGGGTYSVTYDVAKVQADGTDVTNLYRIDIVVTSTTELMHVLGNQTRLVEISALKRAI